MHITEIKAPEKPLHAATFFPPYAVGALKEALAEAEYIVAKDNDLAIEQRAQFVIDRCQFAISRLQEALSRADGAAYVAATLAGQAA